LLIKHAGTSEVLVFKSKIALEFQEICSEVFLHDILILHFWESLWKVQPHSNKLRLLFKDFPCHQHCLLSLWNFCKISLLLKLFLLLLLFHFPKNLTIFLKASSLTFPFPKIFNLITSVFYLSLLELPHIISENYFNRYFLVMFLYFLRNVKPTYAFLLQKQNIFHHIFTLNRVNYSWNHSALKILFFT